MASVTLPNTFDVSKVTVTAPKINEKTGGKSAYLNYNGERLVMQTATQMVLPFGLGVFDKNGTPEYSIEVSFRGMSERADLNQYHDSLAALDQHMLKLGVKNSKLWFKAEQNEQVIRAFYTPTLKLSKDKEGNPLPYPPTVKAKLRRMNGDFEAKFFDENGTPYRGVPVEDLLVKGATVTGLLECTGVWFAGGRFGLSWKVKQMIIHHLPQKMKDFAFVGFSGVAAGADTGRRGGATAAQAVEDQIEDDEVFQAPAVAHTKSSAVSTMMPTTDEEDDEEVAPTPVAVTVSASSMDAEAEDMEPVPVPVRKPIIKKKVVTAGKK